MIISYFTISPLLELSEKRVGNWKMGLVVPCNVEVTVNRFEPVSITGPFVAVIENL